MVITGAGAMENWGIITFREGDLLAPNGTAPQNQDAVGTTTPHATPQPSIGQLYSVPLIVAHEVAHMWFGAPPSAVIGDFSQIA